MSSVIIDTLEYSRVSVALGYVVFSTQELKVLGSMQAAYSLALKGDDMVNVGLGPAIHGMNDVGAVIHVMNGLWISESSGQLTGTPTGIYLVQLVPVILSPCLAVLANGGLEPVVSHAGAAGITALP